MRHIAIPEPLPETIIAGLFSRIIQAEKDFA